MKVSFSSKGEFNALKGWLKKVTTINPATTLSGIASQGDRSLASNTPRATGATAAGWTHKINTKGNISEIVWSNNAHPETEVNMARLIELGHGTRTGGYVPPKPYIKRAMDPVFKTVGDKVVKELIK